MKYMPEKVEVCTIEANRFWAGKQTVYCHSFLKMVHCKRKFFLSRDYTLVKGLEFKHERCLIYSWLDTWLGFTLNFFLWLDKFDFAWLDSTFNLLTLVDLSQLEVDLTGFVLARPDFIWLDFLNLTWFYLVWPNPTWSWLDLICLGSTWLHLTWLFLTLLYFTWPDPTWHGVT